MKLPGRKDKNGNRGPAIDYLPVKERVRWLRDEHPNADIATKVIELTDTRAVMCVRVAIPGGGAAEAIGSETPTGFSDYIEKAGTVALGRALAILGYGIEFADDLDEQREAADPKDYEINQANTVKETTASKRFHTEQAAVATISDEMPQDATPKEIQVWFGKRLGGISIKPKPTKEDHENNARMLAIELNKGLTNGDREDAYEWLTGERSGKTMTPEQVALLFRCASRVEDLHRCAIAMRDQKGQKAS